MMLFRGSISFNSINDRESAGNDKVIFSQAVDIDTAVFYSADTVRLQLDNEEIIVVKKNSAIDYGMDYQYNAYESEDAYVFISKLGNNIHGIIHSASGTYNIETYNDIYVLKKIDMDSVPDDAEPVISDEIMDSLNSSLWNSKSNNTVIRVLVLYTPEALSLRPYMLNKVFTDINNGNNSFINSNINSRFQLAYVGPTANSESGYSYDQLLEKFKNSEDGKFDEVHTLRNKYSADVCVLLVSSDQYCGKGYIKSNMNTAFVVVTASYGCENKYTFTHEIGHNIGCLHDRFVDNSNTPYKYGHGYVHYISGNQAVSWRTIMAYYDECGSSSNCIRIPYWSNPNITHNGIAMGTTTYEDNARVWNERSSTVGAFKTNPNTITLTSSNSQALFESYEATSTITTGAGYEVQTGQTVDMAAATYIRLTPNTHIKSGSKFRASIRNNADGNTYPQFTASRHTDKKESQKESNLSVLPNPIIDILHIHSSEALSSVRIYDLNGQCLLRTTDTEINVSALPAGLYVLTAQTASGDTMQTKFIKQ